MDFVLLQFSCEKALAAEEANANQSLLDARVVQVVWSASSHATRPGRKLILVQSIIRLRVVGANLYRKSIRIQDMKTEAASLLVNRSGPPRLEIRSHRVLLEVVDSDREMVHFGRRSTRPQDQKVFSKHELVVPVPFVDGATEHALIKIGRSLQIADLQRNVVDAVTLESSRLRSTRTGCQHGQPLYQRPP